MKKSNNDSLNINNIYKGGDYLRTNPTWHVEDSPWKAKQILKMIERCDIAPKTICEVGCGAGEILRQLQLAMPEECNFYGYEISPQAFALCQSRSNDKLTFTLRDILGEDNVYYDLIMLIDLIEHLEDYYNLLRGVKEKSQYKIIHIPLDLSVQFLLRPVKVQLMREVIGHLHYFTKEMALSILDDVGYQVIDYFFTAGAVELKAQTIKSYLAKLPRKLFFALQQDWAARILGGYSLLVLAK
jgi:hypothetical protein